MKNKTCVCVQDRNPKQDYKYIYMCIYINNGGKWMKCNKSMNENEKEWTDRQIEKYFFIQKMGGKLFIKMSKR